MRFLQSDDTCGADDQMWGKRFDFTFSNCSRLIFDAYYLVKGHIDPEQPWKKIDHVNHMKD